MRFCPKCGNLMVPVRKGGRTSLRCRVCQYELTAKSGAERGYRVSHSVEKEKKVKTAKVSEPRRPLRSEEEREMIQEYYEIFLESFVEEEAAEE